MHDSGALELRTVGGSNDGMGNAAFSSASDLFLERSEKHWRKEVIKDGATVKLRSFLQTQQCSIRRVIKLCRALQIFEINHPK